MYYIIFKLSDFIRLNPKFSKNLPSNFLNKFSKHFFPAVHFNDPDSSQDFIHYTYTLVRLDGRLPPERH